MGFSRQEFWSSNNSLLWGDLRDPGIEPGSLASQVNSFPSEPVGKPFKNRVFISSSPWAVLNLSPISLKADVLGTHIIHSGLLVWEA